MNDITPEELKQRLLQNEPLTLLDVREPWEHEEFNIGASLYPLYNLPDRLEELTPLQEQEVIVHCQSGKRSGQAKKFLRKNGFKKVRSLIGGLASFHTSPLQS
ncbi:rhodanese-like domain-containing protein [Marinoscillum furvescens]|uniref:Rhodanese-related sulfurtransferase n=1 Tax=Marinoscillum furvescens DSM 4134 TaxID=1122208 RepID=A0A3D9KZU5_MARFU|nr:rhodanese-like domain-containing protein [Marinoscillum furvescens]RED96167.1 rhodanese-related sulfurtransferase [Marinoscillum furvescens DSM 4134]